ncbi:30S ribosomal protein S13 [Candidatus Geothermarchaeota archaeon]|nr:MAG: 30S ribosomal protein S13 [Candidatus Geothermarchaeota archaeon]
MPERAFKEVIRLAGVDLVGFNVLHHELMKIKGIGPTLARVIPRVAGIPENLRTGFLTEKQVEKLERIIKNLNMHVPDFLVNRRKDREKGEDIHLIGSELKLRVERDIEFEKKIGTWRGLRHKLGLKVRGQRTRTTGRKGRTVGVRRKKK